MSIEPGIDLGKGAGKSKGDGAVGDVPPIFDVDQVGRGGAADSAGVDRVGIGWVAALESLGIAPDGPEGA